MKFLMRTAKKYIKRMDIWDFSLLKICLSAMGILIGIGISDEKKKSVGIVAMFVFIATYIPLIAKYIGVVFEEKQYKDSNMDDDCFELLD
jgi:hypothetical protein